MLIIQYIYLKSSLYFNKKVKFNGIIDLIKFNNFNVILTFNFYNKIQVVITLRILVVEDEFSLADIMRIKLKKENYDVDISLDGEEGLDKSLSEYMI